MERERLNQLRMLKKESNDLEKKICKRMKERNPHLVGDTTGDYSTGKKRIITISGEADPVNDKLIRIWKERREKLDEEIIEMERFIDNISDARTRIIVRKYFADGKSQKEIGEELHIERSVISRIITKELD